jgi:hypothetical protein
LVAIGHSERAVELLKYTNVLFTAVARHTFASWKSRVVFVAGERLVIVDMEIKTYV